MRNRLILIKSDENGEIYTETKTKRCTHFNQLLCDVVKVELNELV